MARGRRIRGVFLSAQTFLPQYLVCVTVPPNGFGVVAKPKSFIGGFGGELRDLFFYVADIFWRWLSVRLCIIY